MQGKKRLIFLGKLLLSGCAWPFLWTKSHLGSWLKNVEPRDTTRPFTSTSPRFKALRARCGRRSPQRSSELRSVRPDVWR